MRWFLILVVLLSGCKVDFDLGDVRFACQGSTCPDTVDAADDISSEVSDDDLLDIVAPDGDSEPLPDIDLIEIIDVGDTDDTRLDVLDTREDGDATIAVDPRVSVDPLRGPRGTAFMQAGTGFTPGGAATLHLEAPDETIATTALTIDDDGAFRRAHDSTFAPRLGSYRVWAVDGTAKITSNVAVFLILPSVSVSPTRGPVGTAFVHLGESFTPSGGAVLYLRDPGGSLTEVIEGADAAGAIFHVYEPAKLAAIGEYHYWAVDQVSGVESDAITFTVLEP